MSISIYTNDPESPHFEHVDAMNSTQFNTITSLISNEILRCYKEARIARSKGWATVEQRWYSRAHDLRTTERAFIQMYAERGE